MESSLPHKPEHSTDHQDDGRFGWNQSCVRRISPDDPYASSGIIRFLIGESFQIHFSEQNGSRNFVAIWWYTLNDSFKTNKEEGIISVINALEDKIRVDDRAKQRYVRERGGG